VLRFDRKAAQTWAELSQTTGYGLCANPSSSKQLSGLSYSTSDEMLAEGAAWEG